MQQDKLLGKCGFYCSECKVFPCETILTSPHTTVLDKDWLQWKKQSNRKII